ncbi:MAG TPA: phage holin family protein [Candidatus Dormibacteraeota bacterium]|nr:phage holin family protein [Candidatus Dormibacteraeota bacterium]
MHAPNQRTVPEVLQDIVGNIQEIIRSEFRLGTAEIKEEAAEAAKPVATVGAGIIFGIYALGFLFLAIVYALSTVVAPWMAALIVTGITALMAAVLVASGRGQLKRVKVVPKKTIATVKENVQWATNQMK